MCETTNRNMNHLQNINWIVEFTTFSRSQWKLNSPCSDITLRAEALKLLVSALRVIDFASQRAETLQNAYQVCQKIDFPALMASIVERFGALPRKINDS